MTTQTSSPKPPKRRWKRLLLALFFGLVALAVAGFLTIQLFPNVGAQIADPLRRVIGNEGVARLEEIVFQVEDGLKQAEYGLGLAEPSAPWETETAAVVVMPSRTATPTSQPVSQPTNQLPYYLSKTQIKVMATKRPCAMSR